MNIFYIKNNETSNSANAVVNNIFTKPRFGAESAGTRQPERALVLPPAQIGNTGTMDRNIDSIVRRKPATSSPSLNAMNEPGKLQTEVRHANGILSNAAIAIDREDVAAVHQPRECVCAIAVENYDDIPWYVTLNFPRRFPRETKNHESQMAKEGEELIPKRRCM